MEKRNSNDEISLKELILKIQEYIKEIVKKWWILAIISIITSLCFVYKHYTHIPEYNAELRFVVEGQGGVSGGLGGLLGSIGIKKGGRVNPYKILEVGKSNRIFMEVIFSSYNAKSTIAQKIIEQYDLVSLWSEQNSKYNDIDFTDRSLQNNIDKAVFKKLKYLTWGSPESRKNAWTNFHLDEDKGIYTILTSTTDEKLSVKMTENFYNAIKNFFEDEIFENQKKSAEILAAKADSIKNLKSSKIYELAKFEDRNSGLVYKVDNSRKSILTQEIQALNLAYAELIKNYEMTDVNLKDMQPLFVEIDTPFTPISPSISSLLKNIIIGIMLGIFLGSIIVVLRKVYQEIIN